MTVKCLVLGSLATMLAMSLPPDAEPAFKKRRLGTNPEQLFAAG
jgi:organic hydroperoxide reductase OsmC/OhrA